MMGRRIQMRQLTQIIVLVALGIFWGAPNEADAAEQRCNELGANCICSEPMNTQSYALATGTNWAWNPADTTSLECATSGAAGGFVEVNGFPFQAVSSGESIASLPAGHTNTYVLRTNDGTGGMFAGTALPGSAPTARRSIRFYQYYSTNYSFAGENGGACLNSNKYAQMGTRGAGTGGPMFTVVNGDWSFYDISTSLGWNMDVPCCSGPGPGNTGSGPSSSAMKGKWLRYEIIIRNAAPTGPATTFEAYVKNVTDNGPEIKVVDSSVAKNFPNGENWTVAAATALHPTSTITDMSINMFRNGACTGFAAYSHFVAAAWSSDAGQRIGAAVEIEGGGGTNPAPTAPVGLTIQ